MQVDVLTLRYDATRGVLDDTELKGFTRDKVVLGVRDHFFTVGSVPHLALVVEYRLPRPSAPDGSDGQRKPHGSIKTDELRASLAPGDRELFDLLRSWRASLAHDEGVPAYAVLTNAQLAAIVRARPQGRGGLLKVPGLGQKKANRYADAILAILGRQPQAVPPATLTVETGATR